MQLAIVVIAVSAAWGAAGRHRASPSGNGFEAKLQFCQDCHGPLGQGYRGFFPIPRLAGQQTQYFENQVRAYLERRRTNHIMFNVVRALSPGTIEGLATSFRSFNPGPLGGAPRGLVAKGERIFQDGVPEDNVAACAACHGPDAMGTGEIPRLASQIYPYVIKELINWATERGQHSPSADTSAIMKPIAHSLNRSQIEAVAAYVSDLK